MDLKTQLTERVENALKQYLAAEGADADPASVAFSIEVPRIREHGDFSTNVAMQLPRILRRKPRQIAEEFLGHFDSEGLVAATEIAGLGFINFRLLGDATTGILARIAEEGDTYGHNQTGAGTRVLIEFLSANPTGPLHIGHARNAMLGDIVGRLYSASGCEVTREYYFNDGGVQMNTLGNTQRLRVDEALGRPVEWPEKYYRGDYMKGIAQRMIDERGAEEVGAEHDVEYFTEYAANEIVKTIDADLRAMGIPFDNWFRERSLYESGAVEKALADLRERGAIYEEDGATWFRATDYGDTRNRVVIKSDGTYTYLMPDIAYNDHKFNRGFDEIINVLAADHLGQVPSLLGASEALEHPKEKLHYIIYQMVTLKQGEALMKLSTRSGEFITLNDMIEELGAGVVRYFFAMRSSDSQMTFDWDLAKSTSMDNPVYYVQYAHARCCSLMRKAEEEGCAFAGVENADLSLLALDAEQAILRALERLPQVIDSARNDLAPHHVTNYLGEVAQLFHNFFTQGNNDPSLRIVLPEQPDLTQARLALVHGLKTVLANALGILGIEAMEKM